MMPEKFTVTCCECGSPAGETDCEITATLPTTCDGCHDDYLEQLANNGVAIKNLP
tara:strand:+ start:45 stop:209 length:165 start_codon:yes stop_codon:yes gene_type:complete